MDFRFWNKCEIDAQLMRGTGKKEKTITCIFNALKRPPHTHTHLDRATIRHVKNQEQHRRTKGERQTQ